MSGTFHRIRRTEITVERERRIVFALPVAVSCALCAGSPMLDPVAIALALGVGTRVIYRAIELGRLHFEELHGALTVCLQSARALTEIHEAIERKIR
jgi:hypothetical protein